MNLTRGEGWWLIRRRANIHAENMAAALHVSPDRYRRWEHDREAAPMPHAHELKARLTRGEWCAVQRRRRGWTIAEAAARASISRMTMWKAEHDRTQGVAHVRAFYALLGAARAAAATPVRLRDP